MALPLVPIAIASAVTAISGFITGTLLSDRLGTALTVGGVVVALFLIFILSRRFNLGALGVT